MDLIISEVNSKRELKEFIKFPLRLYAGEKNYVPPLMAFELGTLQKSKNPAFDHSIAKYWIVKKEKEIVGRIAGIILNRELSEKQTARFGWVDFIDDWEISQLLLDTVSDWAKSNGAVKIHGPMGFTDLDFEGALIKGFGLLATQATIYNFPYYQKHYENYGLKKAVDWIERRVYAPDKVPERLIKGYELIKKRYGLERARFKSNKEIKPYAPRFFELLNIAYSSLYGYYPLTEKQIAYYTNQYFRFIRRDFVSFVLNKQKEIVGAAICVPSISKALQKAKGKLFPFGFVHVFKDFYINDTVDLFLICVHPKYQKSGVNAIIYTDLAKAFIKHKIKIMATGPMLEENASVHNLWKDFKIFDNIRRRCYIKTIKD